MKRGWERRKETAGKEKWGQEVVGGEAGGSGTGVIRREQTNPQANVSQKMGKILITIY